MGGGLLLLQQEGLWYDRSKDFLLTDGRGPGASVGPCPNQTRGHLGTLGPTASPHQVSPATPNVLGGPSVWPQDVGTS